VLTGFIVVMVASMPASLLPDILAELVSIVILIAVLLMGTRCIPFLVSLAIGQPMRLQKSWAASRGNAVSVFLALVLAWIPFMIGVFVINNVLVAVGFAQAAPLATVFIMAVLQVIAWTCQASVLAMAYRHMVGVQV
jgi:hypothetical protein